MKLRAKLTIAMVLLLSLTYGIGGAIVVGLAALAMGAGR